MVNTESMTVESCLKEHHRRQTQLCTRLEAIADSLPAGADNQECLAIARRLMPIIYEAHRFEEETLFPLLQSNSDNDQSLDRNLERLRYEHWEDESFAEELAEGLRDFATGPSTEKAEKLSYMLRGFFDGLRRHMAFESEHLLPKLTASRTHLH